MHWEQLGVDMINQQQMDFVVEHVGDTPWHGLGEQLPKKQPIEVWAQAAGMDWQIKESPVHFAIDAPSHVSMFGSSPEQKVLYRSDTNTALSVVSNRYL